MNERLYDVVLGGGARSCVVVGTAKNVGKTVALNALRAVAQRRGISVGLTSIGRDGEAGDALDGRPKPRVRLEAGTVIAAPRDLLARSPAFEIVGTGEASALGTIVFARVRQPLWCEVGGPPTARGVRAAIDRLRALTDGPVFVDGAIDRVAPLAGGDDAIVLATGAAAAASVDAVAELTRAAVLRLSVPALGVDAAAHVVTGALDTRDAQALLAAPPPGPVVVADPTRIAVRGKLLAALLAAIDLRCERALRIAACTASSAGGPRAVDPRELVRAVAAATGLPCFDVVAGVAA